MFGRKNKTKVADASATEGSATAAQQPRPHDCHEEGHRMLRPLNPDPDSKCLVCEFCNRTQDHSWNDGRCFNCGVHCCNGCTFSCPCIILNETGISGNQIITFRERARECNYKICSYMEIWPPVYEDGISAKIGISG